MARAKELKDLTVDELRERIGETREELFNLRFQHATGQLDNYRRIRELRRDVARMKTLIRQRELDIREEGQGG